MSKKSLYYLVGRDRITNDFQIIPIAGKCGNSLEEIDLYTTNYDSVTELMKALLSQGIIKSMDMDFFIVSQKKNKEDRFLSFQDILFKDSHKIREIAVASQNNNLESVQKQINDILNHFCYRMKYQPMFYNMVVYGDTNLYPKFVKYFASNRYQDYYQVKYLSDGWVQRSYVLLRNIMDSFHQKDYSFGNSEHFDLDYIYRELLEESLLEVTDNNYIENQKSIFDISPEISTEDKIIEVMDTFKKIPKGVFIQQGNSIVFNTELFGKYEDDDKNKLNSLLGGRLAFLVQMHSFHNYYLEKSLENMKDSSKLEKQIKEDEENIYHLLQNSPDILNQAYQWILLYQKYCNRIVGDEFGYQHQKRKRN